MNVEHDYRHLKAEIVELANSTLPLMDGTTEPIKVILAENDVVFGVWQDASASDGVGMRVIKGRRKLEALASLRRPPPVGTVRFARTSGALKIAAIPCSCAEQAVSAARTVGDGE